MISANIYITDGVGTPYQLQYSVDSYGPNFIAMCNKILTELKGRTWVTADAKQKVAAYIAYYQAMIELNPTYSNLADPKNPLAVTAQGEMTTPIDEVLQNIVIKPLCDNGLTVGTGTGGGTDQKYINLDGYIQDPTNPLRWIPVTTPSANDNKKNDDTTTVLVDPMDAVRRAEAEAAAAAALAADLLQHQLNAAQIDSIIRKHTKVSVLPVSSTVTVDTKWQKNSKGTTYRGCIWLSQPCYKLIKTEELIGTPIVGPFFGDYQIFADVSPIQQDAATPRFFYKRPTESTYTEYIGKFAKYIRFDKESVDQDSFLPEAMWLDLLYPETFIGTFGSEHDTATVYNNDMLFLEDGLALVPNCPLGDTDDIWGGGWTPTESFRLAPWFVGCFRKIRFAMKFADDSPMAIPMSFADTCISAYFGFSYMWNGPYDYGTWSQLPDGSIQYEGLLRDEAGNKTELPILGGKVQVGPQYGPYTEYDTWIMNAILYDAQPRNYANNYTGDGNNAQYDDGNNIPAWTTGTPGWLTSMGGTKDTLYVASKIEFYACYMTAMTDTVKNARSEFYPIGLFNLTDPPWQATSTSNGTVNEVLMAPACLNITCHGDWSKPIIITKCEVFDPYVPYSVMMELPQL